MAILDKYNNLTASLEDDADSSNTYYGNATPTSADISLNKRIKANEAAEDIAASTEAKSRWYPKTTSAAVDASTPEGMTLEPQKENKSYMANFLKLLTLPTSVEVGAIESLTGKGTKPGMLANIKSNIDEGEGFGSLLRKFGVNGKVSTVAGFGLDVALDPVNMLSMGTGAIVPRVVQGIIKGGTEGALKGLATSSLGKITEGTIKFGTKFAGDKGVTVAKDIIEKQAKNLSDYNKIIGYDPYEKLMDVYKNGSFASNVFDKTAETITKMPGGEDFLKNFIYRPLEFTGKQRAVSEMQSEIVNSMKSHVSGKIESLDNLKAEMVGKNMWTPEAEIGHQKLMEQYLSDDKDLLAAGARPLEEGLGAAASPTTKRYYGGSFTKALAEEHYNKLAVDVMADRLKMKGLDEATIKDYLSIAQKGKDDLKETGWKFYDDMVSKVYNWKVKDVEAGSKMADAYNKALGMFKTVKVGNPSSIVTAAMGNPAMAAIKGYDVTHGNYWAANKEALYALKGWDDNATFVDMIKNPEVAAYLEANPEFFKSIMGFHPMYALNKKDLAKMMDDVEASKEFAAELNMKGFSTVEEREKALLDAQEEIKRNIEAARAQSVKTSNLDKAEPDYVKNFSPMERLFKNGPDITNTFVSQELDIPAYRQMIKDIGEKAAAGNPAYKVLNWYLTKPIKAFEMVDQTYKFGEFIHLTKYGVTENEIMRLSKLGRYKPTKAMLSTAKKGEDVWAGVPADIGVLVNKKGKTIASRGEYDVFLDPTSNSWKFHPGKALEEASETYMNYAAMPTAVKVLRSLPLVGAPFVAFQWAMMHKTGQALVANPEILNKIQFALNEINGGRSPLERKTLDSPYASYYNKMGMVSLPFFQDNIYYLNLAPYLPMLSMNLFQPSERNYEKNMGGVAAKFLDASPFFKGPEGGMIADYFIMPMLMRDSASTGQFNNLLFPNDATALEKAKEVTKRIIETYTQNNIPAPLGLVTPESVLDWIPNRKWQQVGYAEAGKGLHGVIKKEDSVNATARQILSAWTGINVYPVNTNFTN